MTIHEIVSLVKGKILCGNVGEEDFVEYCFASDLMSDVLTVRRSDFMLITGLSNVQSIRTAEMSDLKYVMLVRGKTPPQTMIELAEESGIVLIMSPYSMFKASGILYMAGLKGVFLWICRLIYREVILPLQGQLLHRYGGPLRNWDWMHR
ncbi:MAG: hypothetical protein PHC79_05275 [Bacteroidales bacterium]|nr:hypothetical protein [Bacteroidales bacterium]